MYDFDVLSDICVCRTDVAAGGLKTPKVLSVLSWSVKMAVPLPAKIFYRHHVEAKGYCGKNHAATQRNTSHSKLIRNLSRLIFSTRGKGSSLK